ncbi:6-carboxyhexanoate--CoA ligase [Sphaerisporangium siamense]|uniref:Acetyltransferase n=1 Tax=Sphaerisporangium siamense TaxID=795645 RepID=A0A7W7D670_9ACTN|nr:acetate--CoA ligase family protein [Sphaerisporangium siamense]MBB4699663.1 acetyltransferase [Sphaerisporangium siamense]GII87841.1 6-carboxyhexanoate--CoA ligase [Sphaerisporangium siamense]
MTAPPPPPALDRLLSPRSIAMVGASNSPTRIGGTVFGNLLRAFPGEVHPVHPKDEVVQGRTAYRSVSDLPEAVDMAVIAVPARAVVDVVAECAARGIGGATVITSGFAEAGPEGRALQDRLTAVAHETGIRVIGPNCIGYMNTHGGVMANFMITPDQPLPESGPVALVSQSGGFGSYITNKAVLAGLRLGWFVSTGNEADVNVAQVLRHLVERPEVGVLLSFVETLRDPEIFMATARRAAELDKPLVLLKAGRSDEAARAAMSHTASIVGSAQVFDAVCRQYGVFVASTMEELLDLGTIFQDGRRAAGDRVIVMTSSGGAGVLLADEAGQAGLSVPELPAEEQAALEADMPLPFYGSTSNPVDTTAQTTAMPDAYRKVLNKVAASPSGDMVAAVTWAGPGPANDAIVEMYRNTAKPVAILSTAWSEQFQRAGVPTFTDPRRAMASLSALARLSARGPVPPDPEAFAADGDRVRRVRELIAAAGEETTLLESTGKSILAMYDVPVTREELVTGVDAAVEAAARIGGPVAIKVMSYRLPHKSDAGAIRLGLRGPDAVRDGYREMLDEVARRAPDARVEGVLVQQMAPARLELTCGVQRDPVFGPMVAVGLGGVLVEVLSEAVLLRPPFDADAAVAALGRLLGGRLVTGRRGLSEEELRATAQIMTGLGALALELDEVAEVDVNPLRVADGAVLAADALIVVRHD